MSRLTKENEKYGGNLTQGMKIYNKLFDIENLEEELGIDLITLFKALKNGIYVDLNGFVKLIAINDLSLKFYIKRWYLGFYHSLNGGTFYVDLKDFKKTWWLDKPKENEND